MSALKSGLSRSILFVVSAGRSFGRAGVILGMSWSLDAGVGERGTGVVLDMSWPLKAGVVECDAGVVEGPAKRDVYVAVETSDGGIVAFGCVI